MAMVRIASGRKARFHPVLLLTGTALALSACSEPEPQPVEAEAAEEAEPEMSELEMGMRRMENEKVLVLSEAPLDPLEGVQDEWEYTLAPFESIEFKYTIAEDEPIVFQWQATDEVHYDMHSHPFDGGTELTESYGIDDAEEMHGEYIPAFTGIHGWFWENRTLEDVTVRLKASGVMTNSTIFSGVGSVERPLEGVESAPDGAIAGHEMQEF